MIRLKTLLEESATPQQVEQTNTKEILQWANLQIDANVKPMFKSILKQPVIQYVTALNAQSDMISKYIKFKKSNEAVHLYFKTFSDVYFKSLASLGSITKFAVRKLVSEQEIRRLIEQYRDQINEYYISIFENTFSELVKPRAGISNAEQKLLYVWNIKCFDIIYARRDTFLNQLIEAGLKTIYR